MKKHIAVIGAGLSGITIASIIKEKFKVESSKNQESWWKNVN